MTNETTLKAQRSVGWRIGYLFAAAAVFLLDQTTKAWALRALRFDDKTIIRNFLDLVYAENPGVAFGQLQQGGDTGRWMLVGLACAASIAVLVYFFRTTKNDDRTLGACALLLAGIVGNLTDRILLGHVVDFILVHYHSWNWPVFNVADMAICAGALLFAVDVIFESRHQKSESKIQNQKQGGSSPLSSDS